jgi:hypothetical protein
MAYDKTRYIVDDTFVKAFEEDSCFFYSLQYNKILGIIYDWAVKLLRFKLE